MARELATIVVAVLIPCAGLSQTIARSDLKELRCGVALGAGGDECPVVGAGFEYWSIDSPEPAASPDKRANGIRVIEMVCMGDPPVAKAAAGGEFLFVPLQARQPSQFRKYLLSVWTVSGDTIQFRSLSEMAKVGNPGGGFAVSEARESSDGSALVFTESKNSDEDLTWGILEVLRYKMATMELDRVYRETYSHCFTMRSDSLTASWQRESGKDLLQVVRRVTDAVFESATGWRTYTVSAETTKVNVEELASR